jgi:hypothetical protein
MYPFLLYKLESTRHIIEELFFCFVLRVELPQQESYTSQPRFRAELDACCQLAKVVRFWGRFGTTKKRARIA